MKITFNPYQIDRMQTIENLSERKEHWIPVWKAIQTIPRNCARSEKNKLKLNSTII